MKKENWFKSLELVDDKYLAESNPGAKVKYSTKKRITISIISAAACLALVLGNLWLFLPFNNTPPDVSRYSNSKYYEIIKKINLLTYEESKYKNNFEYLTEDIFEPVLKGEIAENNMSGDGLSDAPTMSNGDTYTEITDNQVEGIIEADRIKRTDKYIFYLDNETLRVFSIAGLNSMELGHIVLYESSNNCRLDKWEFYLSLDCKTATVITQYYNNKKLCVGIISLDVSNPNKITEKKRIDITGSYISSRMTDGKLILLTEFVFNKNDIDFDNEATFLPQMNTGDGMKSVPADNIFSPDKINATRYTVIMKLNENSLKLEGTAAFLSYTDDVYVSNENIFLTFVFADVKKEENGNELRNSMTEISCLTYKGNTFEHKGTVTVRGYVKDQWSMDEYEGILRVVTTTNATTVRKSNYSNGSVSYDTLVTATGNSNASLYCVNLKSFKVVAKVENFAPPREEVQSVRFDKNTAYVCTSVEISDPVFFFDLTNLENITHKETGTIAGFSTSLINFENGKLLGIGRSDWSTFKVEIYEETENDVIGFCKYELKNTEYSTNYKSYYIDRENQLIGLGVYNYNNGYQPKYIVLYFDGYNLVELVNTPLKGDPDYHRGVFIDDYMYMFGENDFKVIKLFD